MLCVNYKQWLSYDYQHLTTIVGYYAVLVFYVAGPEYTEIQPSIGLDCPLCIPDGSRCGHALYS